jgi:hypothetical protein
MKTSIAALMTCGACLAGGFAAVGAQAPHSPPLTCRTDDQVVVFERCELLAPVASSSSHRRVNSALGSASPSSRRFGRGLRGAVFLQRATHVLAAVGALEFLSRVGQFLHARRLVVRDAATQRGEVFDAPPDERLNLRLGSITPLLV